MYTLVPPSYIRRFISNLALIDQMVSEKQIFDYYCDEDVFCPGVGTDKPMGSIIFQNH